MITIKKKVDCCGCQACANACPTHCIRMEEDAEGFWYPKVDQNACIGCGLCERVCPILRASKKTVEDDNAPMCYAVISQNEEERMQSSSGGVFSLIAKEILARDGVVYGASFDESYRKVIHKGITSTDELTCLQGSKYVQSDVGNSYLEVRELLAAGRWVLFTGTPCQIGGLKAYLNREYDRLYTADVVCHGAPSPKIWNLYVDLQEKEAGARIQNVLFRSKKEGWNKYGLQIVYENGAETLNMHREDDYMKAFLRNASLRPSCYACKFARVKRDSDISLGDFWGVEHILPGLSDDQGVSFVMLNSAKGRELFEWIVSDTKYEKVDLQQALPGNPCIVESVMPHINRKKFFEMAESMPFDELVDTYCRQENHRLLRLRKKLRSLTRR